MPQDLTDDSSIVVQVVPCEATSHYLNQYWQSSMTLSLGCNELHKNLDIYRTSHIMKTKHCYNDNFIITSCCDDNLWCHHWLKCCIHCYCKISINCSFLIALFFTNAKLIWVRSRRWGCLVTWFCYHLIAKPGNKTAAPSWPDPYVLHIME